VTVVTVHHQLSGPPGAATVALAGSLGTSLAMWDDQAQALTGRFRVLRYDHRGHGRSPAPLGPYRVEDLAADLLALLDRLGLARVHLAGLSLGGMTAMWLAAHAPQRVDRLALLCTSAYLPPAQGWRERAANVRAQGTAALADAALGRWFTPALREARPELAARFRAMLSAIPAEGYAGCCEAIAALDLRADLGRITAPTLVIAGREDPATPPEHAERIAAAIRGARLVVLPGAAHLANVEQAGEVNRLLTEHLEGT
jgi:3-oxoadipate enol-lactonase